MKCPKCGGTGFVPTNVFGVNGAIKCDFCDGTGVFITNAVEPMTNEKWFCQLSTEEKAEFMGDIWGKGYLTSHFEGNLEFCKKQDKAYWEMWLKQPYTEKE